MLNSAQAGYTIYTQNPYEWCRALWQNILGTSLLSDRQRRDNFDPTYAFIGAVALAEGFLLSQAEVEKKQKEQQVRVFSPGTKVKNLMVEVHSELPVAEKAPLDPRQNPQWKAIQQECDGGVPLQEAGMMPPTRTQSPLPLCSGPEPDQ
ncbi:hypothetical protein JD844_013954, partial [Phrynosoma platyrhinos]